MRLETLNSTAVAAGNGRWRAPACRMRVLGAVAVAAVVALLPMTLEAQMEGPRLASRGQLEALRDSLQGALASARNGEERQAIQDRLDGLEYRLQHGDIWPGDVVSLEVTGEDKWTNDFTVMPGRRLELPDIPPLSLEGVLYAETEEAIARQLTTYLREPRVRVRVLKRVAVLGAVGSPGFYDVPGSSLVSDVVMRAGGPAGNAKLDKLRVRRHGSELEQVRARPRVAFQNLSLDQLGVVSGDEIYIPAAGGGSWRIVTGALGLVGSIVFILHRI